MSKLTPAMIAGLNFIGKFGSVHGVRAATVKALISRELVWDEGDQWYLTSDAHNLDEVTDEAREADLARQEARNEQGADVQVFQGAMHEATTPQAIGDTLTVLAGSMTGVAEALNTVGLAAQAAARKLAAVAWSHQVAVVRSMGHTVRGKVVDTVLREPGADGTGRVCLVVEHQEEATDRLGVRTWGPAGHAGHPRRTLHALSDVQFEALAS